MLQRVLRVLGALCTEMRTLEHQARTQFYDAILFYSEPGESWVSSEAPGPGRTNLEITTRRVGGLQSALTEASIMKRRQPANLASVLQIVEIL